MRRLTCKSCNALLPRPGARCRNCGWAAKYETWSPERKRELRAGIALLVGTLSMAVAVAVVLQIALAV